MRAALLVSMISLSACGDLSSKPNCNLPSDCNDGLGCLDHHCVVRSDVSQNLPQTPFTEPALYLVNVKTPGAYYVVVDYDATGTSAPIRVALGDDVLPLEGKLGSGMRLYAGPFENVAVGDKRMKIDPGTDVTVNRLSVQPAHLVGFTISGLAGSGLILSLSGDVEDELEISASDSVFRFKKALAPEMTYTITIKTPPTHPAQRCYVENATGTMGDANVATAVVNCMTLHQVAGTIENLKPSANGLVLHLAREGGPEDGKEQSLSVPPGATEFEFQEGLAPGETYTITVERQPNGQWCVVSRDAGTMGGLDATDVKVGCCVAEYRYCGNDHLFLDPKTLYLCNRDAPPSPILACTTTCVIGADNDFCSCGTGFRYCGGDDLEGDSNKLYACQAGGALPAVLKTDCTLTGTGCRVNEGAEDTCY